MSAIRIHRRIDSETLHLPELKPVMGKTVEILVTEAIPATRDEFYSEAARLPESEPAFEAQQSLFRTWRSDSRFEAYWPVLDSLLARRFATVRQWAAIRSQLPLEDYDYDALPAQEAYDREDARRRMS